jgi:hypothetical protein
LKNKSINAITSYEDQFKYNTTEVGMRNSKTDSHVKIFDNGNVEIFAGDETGVIINDQYNTVNFYGNATNVNSYNTNISTRPYGLSWNGYLLNPQLYQLYDDDLMLSGSIRYWVEATNKTPAHWARRTIDIRPFIKCSESDEFASLLSELGIPK